MKIIVIREGSAVLLSEFGQQLVKPGDVVVLAANTLCGSEPEGSITATTLYLDRDYVIDQVFWQRAAVLRDRWQAQDFADELYSEPAQILHLGEDRAGLLMPWLDELAALSIDGHFARHFFRMQALWFSVAHVIAPFVTVSPVRVSPSQRAHIRPGLPRNRRFAPLRTEALAVRDALSGAVAQEWTMSDLGRLVHLSPRQIARVFTAAYGKTPRTYLTMLRVQEMARLLRETDLTVAVAGQRVGWRSRTSANNAFHSHTGMTPAAYRNLHSKVPSPQNVASLLSSNETLPPNATTRSP